MSATDHYETLLADHYTWMSGPFDERVAEQRALLSGLSVSPQDGGRALDLGCGAGLQSVALAELGFDVTSVDASAKLLAELDTRKAALPIRTVLADIAALPDTIAPGFAVVVCMGDTLTHLPSMDAIELLIGAVADLLASGGLFALTFRDLTAELTGTDRFIPVRGDADRIMTCFIEYETTTVLVHDLIHLREGAEWTLKKSSYRKLRLSPGWVCDTLARCGFSLEVYRPAGRMVLISARRA